MSFSLKPRFPSYSQQPRMSSYGNCESFFVESDEAGLFALRAQERERARLQNKEIQRNLAQEISNLTRDEYERDILEHMERMEVETLPDVNSIEIQTEIQWYMRPYLLDFLVEAHSAFNLHPETLFLTINLLDRYCSKRVVYKRHYQLVGCAALLIAAKYGDRKDRVPTVRELRGMCCSLYEDEMFTQMEYHVLATLNWMVGHPTIDAFLQLALSEHMADLQLEQMTLYLCEISLFSKDFVSVLPSVMARSALALARCVLSRSVQQQSDWASSYDASVVVTLAQKMEQPSHVVSTKYSSPTHHRVSDILQEFLHRQHQLSCEPVVQPPALVTMMPDQRHQQPTDSQHMMPHTPQKGQYSGPAAVYGYMTPPITPDTEFAATANGVYGQSRMIDQRLCPATPTPPSSIEPANQNMQYSSERHFYTTEDPSHCRNSWQLVNLPAVHVSQYPADYIVT